MKKTYLLLSIVLGIFMVASVFAIVSYFHQTNVDLTVSEARTSADLPFSLGCNSGETISQDVVIHNNANVPLKAQLDWTENTNTGVTYTNNLPAIVDLAPSADTAFTVTFTCDAATEVGSVNGTINYSKTK